MIEVWKPIPGEPMYEVSNLGRVRSLYSSPPLVRKLTRHRRDGYLQVSLRRKSGYKVHQLVLAAFVGPRPSDMVTRHLNGDPADNRLENLTYGTQSENNYDRTRHGTDPNAVKTHCPRGHPYSEENTYRLRGGRFCRACACLATKAYRSRRAAHRSAGAAL